MAPRVARWPLPERLLLSARVVVVLLGWVVMPGLTRLFARWLHPDRGAGSRSRASPALPPPCRTPA